MLADKFGETGTQLFNIMVSAQRLDAIVGTVFGALLIIIGYFIYKKFGLQDDYGYSPTVIIIPILFFIGILYIFINIQGLVYPEAVMIKGLLK